MNDAAALQVLGLRPGATPVDVRKAYLASSLRHHPDKGGDVLLFRRIATAYTSLRGGARPNESAEALHQRVTREDAPTSWAPHGRQSRDDTGAVPLLEADPQLEAAFQYAAQSRKHQEVLHKYAGYAFDPTGDECQPGCMPHLRADGKAMLCDLHKRVHTCTPDVCCAADRGCVMTIMYLARTTAQSDGMRLLTGNALQQHRCSSAACRWIELTALRDPKDDGRDKRGSERRQRLRRQVFVCAASGRSHICTASQCRAGRETQVLDERGGLARQFKCAISHMPLGPLMPWADGITLPLGTEPLRLTHTAAGGAEQRCAKRSRGDGGGRGAGGGDVRQRLMSAPGMKAPTGRTKNTQR